VKAADIKSALVQRWPDDQYVHVYEAPTQSDRGGNKIDVLVCALWWSKQHEIDAVEIKCSYGDWKNEIETREFVIERNGTEAIFASLPAAKRKLKQGEVVIARSRPDTTKSQLWRERSHRFWIACPAALAVRIKAELPAGWGLLAVSPSGELSIVMRPNKNSAPYQLTWPQCVGVIRAAADSGVLAIQRAENRGFMRQSSTQGVL